MRVGVVVVVVVGVVVVVRISHEEARQIVKSAQTEQHSNYALAKNGLFKGFCC